MSNATHNSKSQPSASDRFTTTLTQVKTEMEAKRCPVRFSMEMLGDKWTLLIIRDMALFEACRYGELQQSLGDISTNILANRLKRLTENGLIEKFKDPADGKSAIYLLTDKGLDLLPVLGQLIRWGMQYDELSALPSRAQEILKNSAGFLNTRRAQLKQQRTLYGKKTSQQNKNQ